MPLYETAKEAIVQAGSECGLSGLSDSTDVWASTDPAVVQMRNIASSAGREMLALHTWQRLITEYSHTFASPADDSGVLALPDDFGYMIPQTGWSPVNAGMGMPLAGPLSPQDWTYIVNSGLAQSTIYISFRQQEGSFKVLPIPPPVGTEINYQYVKRNWALAVDGTTYKDKLTANDDTVLYIPILYQKFLKLRFLEAKGFDTTSALAQFQTVFMQWTGNDISAPILSMARNRVFPYLGWRNIPETNYGLP
jgi:hypothetical protein